MDGGERATCVLRGIVVAACITSAVMVTRVFVDDPGGQEVKLLQQQRQQISPLPYRPDAKVAVQPAPCLK